MKEDVRAFLRLGCMILAAIPAALVLLFMLLTWENGTSLRRLFEEGTVFILLLCILGFFVVADAVRKRSGKSGPPPDA